MRGNPTCLTLIIFLYPKWLHSSAFWILLHYPAAFVFTPSEMIISHHFFTAYISNTPSSFLTVGWWPFFTFYWKIKTSRRKVMHLPTTRSNSLHAALHIYVYMCVCVCVCICTYRECVHTHKRILHSLLTQSPLFTASLSTYVTNVFLLICLNSDSNSSV